MAWPGQFCIFPENKRNARAIRPEKRERNKKMQISKCARIKNS